MSRPPLLSMNDIAREDEKSRYEQFLHDTEEFPCVFNAKVCKLNIDDTTFKGIDVDISVNKLNSLLEDLNEDYEVGECDQLVWKQNLLTYVYTRLNCFKEACILNRKILSENGMNNLVAQVNAAFLCYKTDNQKEAQQIIDELKKVKLSQQFADMKYGAICELGYTFRKLGGAKNLQISISVLECALSFHPDDEAIQLMLAIVLRRCTHLAIYSSDPENINRHDCALKAARSLWKLGTKSSNTAIQAAALIELAFLKYGEDYLGRCSYRGGQSGRGGRSCNSGRRGYRGRCSCRQDGQNYRQGGQNYRWDGQSYRQDEQNYSSGHSYREGGQSYRQDGQSYRQDGQSYRQSGQSYRQSGQSYRWDGQSYRPDGQSYRQSGQSYRWDGQSYRPDGQSYRQGGQSYRQDGESYRDRQVGTEGEQRYSYSHSYETGQPCGDVQNYTGEQRCTGRQRYTGELGNRDVKQSHNKTSSILSRGEWFEIVQDRTWMQLCEDALEICKDGPSEKVLKIAGQLFRYCSKDDDEEYLKKSEKLFLRAIEKRPSPRAHHHLGLTYKRLAVRYKNSKKGNEGFNKAEVDGYVIQDGRQNKAVPFADITTDTLVFTEHHQDNRRLGYTHQDNKQRKNEHKERFESNTEGTDDFRMNVLPPPLANMSPQKLRQGLKYMSKVPNKLDPFSKDNPYVNKAVYHLEQAVVLSHYQNKIAVYDYACMLVQTEETEKSKVACRHLIRECTSSKTFTTSPMSLVNAYNLIGICYAKEAEVEVDLVNRNVLLAESEKNLTMAVRQASCLAAAVPELAMCVTDLWNAFKTLKRVFTFKGTEESREDLFRLCKYISDYRFLQAVDEIILQDPTELDKIEVVEQCLRRYLNMKAFDSALLFRDLVYLRPEVKSKLPESKVYKQLMLEVAEGKLGEMFVNGRTNTNHPDPVWKQLFTDEYYQKRTYKKYDIVIVHDIDKDYEPKQGYPDTVSGYLKLVLQEIFGLTAVRAHAEGNAGQEYLTEQPQIISQSGVAIFVLTDPSNESEFLATRLASLQISQDEHSLPENVRQIKFDQPLSEQDEETRQNGNNNSLSPIYERIINISVNNFLSKKGTSRILLVTVGDLQQEAMPQGVRGLPTLQLSPNDIETLKTTAEGGSAKPCLQLVTRIFRDILGFKPLNG